MEMIDREYHEGLAAEAFEARERVRMLEMCNTPVDYEARKKAFIELEIARAMADQAEGALRQAKATGTHS